MSQSSMIQRKGGPSSFTRRNLDSEDEVIRIPDCDLEAASERFRLTLMGRVLHLRGRSTDALIHLLPRPRIWNVEGRVRGLNLGNGRFQFDFDNEADLIAVLNKRPCHLNQWSFALERWEPSTSESFPNTIPFWITVTGVPVHYWNDQTFEEISKALGKYLLFDSKKARMQVSINIDKPLIFERGIEFPNGDIGRVTFAYEGLHRFCFTCNMISHDENSCPLLTQEEREVKRLQRADAYANDNNSHPTLNDPASSARAASIKRPRSPHYERQWGPSAKHISDDSRRVEKRQKHSPSRDIRTHRAYSDDHTRRTHNSRHPRTKEAVWERLEPPHRASHSSTIERNKLLFSSQKSRAFMPPSHRGGGALANTSQRFEAQVWRPRHTPRADSSNNRSPPHRALARNHDPHARALSDSQRTISDNLGNPEQGEIVSGDRPRSTNLETPEERLRRIKGKAHISEEPTSRERGPLIHNAPLIIRDQEERAQRTHSSIPARLAESSAGKEKQIAGNIDMELDFDYGHDLDGQDLETPLTELETAEVDNLVKETELLEMNAMLMETDDLLGDELLGDTPDDNAEQIEAISQLSPANAEQTMEMQVDQQHTNVSQDAPSVKNTKRSASNIRTAIASTEKAPTPAKGYLKNHISRSPDVKGVMASKKLHSRRGRASPKKKAPAGKSSMAQNITLPRFEVLPSALSKKSVSLSGSVVSQKPSSKKI